MSIHRGSGWSTKTFAPPCWNDVTRTGSFGNLPSVVPAVACPTLQSRMFQRPCGLRRQQRTDRVRSSDRAARAPYASPTCGSFPTNEAADHEITQSGIAGRAYSLQGGGTSDELGIHRALSRHRKLGVRRSRGCATCRHRVIGHTTDQLLITYSFGTVGHGAHSLRGPTSERYVYSAEPTACGRSWAAVFRFSHGGHLSR